MNWDIENSIGAAVLGALLVLHADHMQDYLEGRERRVALRLYVIMLYVVGWILIIRLIAFLMMIS